MKPHTICLFLAALLFSPLSVPPAFSGGNHVDWDAFSHNLVRALVTPNDGLRQSAMRQVIKYGDNLDLNEGVFEIVRMYRTHKDLQVRRLALATLPKTNSKWVMGFLRRAVEFEDSPVLRKQIYFILRQHDAKENASAFDERFGFDVATLK